MSKRLQFNLNEEAVAIIEKACAEANLNFSVGNITPSHIVEEFILTGKIEVKDVQKKHTNWRRSLRTYAGQEDLDLDSVIKNLQELKARIPKKPSKNQMNLLSENI